MTKIFLSIALLLQLSTMQGLPCSEYYTYLKKPGTNEILGRIEIPSHPRNVQYHLRVGFNTQPWIHRNGPVARLEVAQRTKKTIGALQQGRPLLYHVHFPVGQAIPRLTKIWFNDQQLCPNPEGTEYLRTTFVIEQMYPSGTEPLSLNSSSYQNSSTIVNSSLTNYISEGINKKIIPKTIRTKKSVQYNNNNISNNDNNNNNECSISDDNDDINLMVAYGLQTSSERWPWLVALFIFKEEVYKFACSGSILTTKHVITAAHCMSSVSNVHPNVLVILGKFNMTQWQEEQEVIKREIVSYKIHPDYAHTTSGDSDLAILTLKIPIEFSPFIKPVCLWSGPANLQNIINRIGYVVGWGMTELGHFSEEPHMTGMPIVNQRTCLDSHKRFSILTSERTFCAGWRNGSGPCNGDSGSGLMLFNDTTNRYQMRGLVSRSLLLRENKLSCDLRNYVVFVDVAKYIPWIQEQTSMENRPTSAEPTSQTDNYDECGISTYREDINLLIANGQNTLPGQWPWLAAVFTIQNFTKGFEFRCVGTILSTHHVLTAAYCLEHMNDWSKPLSTLEVALGRFNLRYIREEGTVIRKVSYYRVYPNDHPNRGSGDSHWAILILTPPIEFNPFIRSICLWSGSTTFQDVVGKTGYVVGWGEGEYGHPYTEQPRMGKMKIVTKEKCFRDEGIDDAMLLNFNFTTENIFCAQSRSSPCNSDSGSGLIFFNNTINRYQLRGMVLRPMLHRNTLIRPSCSGMDSFLFIDLAKYTPWIQEKISAEQPYYKPTLPLQNINNNNYNECGISQYREDLLITQDMWPTLWPWMVTLFVRDEYKSFYRTGTILTTRHVLTAAHCLGKFVRIGNYTVFDLIHYSVIDVALGLWKYGSTYPMTYESVIRDLASYKIHPDYKHGKSSDADLAILILRIPVEFNLFIRPICLWSGSTILQDVVGRTGYIVGWPEQIDIYSITGAEGCIRILKASIVSQENCSQIHENISTFTSDRTFCADWRNNGPCTRCDGSGLVLFNDTTNRYELRGVVSHTENGDLQNYVIHVDVVKYIPWIQEQISMENMMPTLAQLYAQINNNNYNECGISQYREDLLITHGQDMWPTRWPWMVTLFVRDEHKSFYRTGTILTTRHVLTAAHCLGKFVRIGNYTVFDLIHYSVIDIALGLWKYGMMDYTYESVIRDLASYKIHPDYKHGKSSDSDLAILILRIPIEFNRFIRPVCLWSGSTILQDVVGRIGYVVGWPEQTGVLTTPTYGHRILKASIVSQENCSQTHENISTFTSERTFCADWRNISGPCTKCDGSGLVLFNDTTNRYELRGIVSHTENGELQNYVIYVDVAKYIPWIQEQISMENMMPTLAQLYAQINN